MSLDARLRTGLREAAEALEPDVESRLVRTRQQQRRRRTTQRLALVAAVVVALLVAVPVADRLTRTDRMVPVGPLSDAEARRLLRDTWVTPVVTRDQVASTLRAAGLEQHLAVVALDVGYPMALSLALNRDGYLLSTARGVMLDHGDWTVRGSTLRLLPIECSPCEMTFRWQVRGNRLTLTLLTDASPATADGVPDEAYARGVYTVAPFTRFVAPTP